MKQKTTIRYIFTAILICLSVTLFSGKIEAASSVEVTGTCNYDYAYEVLKIVNQEREKKGKDSLVMDKELLKVAMMRAAECTVSFSHIRPNGKECFSASSMMYAENIAYGYSTPKVVMNGWMNSSGHKTNILNGDYKVIGIGCFYKDGTYYWAQCFGFEGTQTSYAPSNGKVTYRVALSGQGETKLVEKTDPVATKVSGVKAFAGKKKLALQWKKKKDISGYQLQISDDDEFKSRQTYMVSKTCTNKVITKYKGKRLKAKKRYYVRIRAYVNSTDSNGEKIKKYSKWNTIDKKTK